jgi:colanic acid/amylovoran biosynthesis protein
MRPLKIAIANTVALNTGDAAILQSIIIILRRAFGDRVRIVAYDKSPAAVARTYPEIDFEPSIRSQVISADGGSLLHRVADRFGDVAERAAALRFYAAAWLYGRGLAVLARLLLPAAAFRQLERLAQVDLVVSTGGTYLVEHYQFEKNLFDLTAAILLRRPVALFTQSLGPFTRTRSRRRMRWIADRAVAVLVRDRKSADHLADIGCRLDNVHVVPDAAFALEALAPRTTRPPERPRVAVSVREWKHFRTSPAEGFANYVACIRELVVHLVRDRGADVTFLSTCQGLPDYWTDDSKTASRIVDDLPPDVRASVLVDREFRTPDALLRELAGYSAVVATRMHMAILALCAGRPVVPIAYEFKTEELFRALGYGHLIHDIETVRADALLASVDRVLDDAEDIGRDLRRKARELSASAMASGAALRNALEPHDWEPHEPVREPQPA